MLTPTTPAPSLRRFSLADQATALAIILKKEFGVPFAFYDAVKGQRVAKFLSQRLGLSLFTSTTDG